MFKSLLTGLVATVLSVGCSFAQSYPTKPIVMIVPFAAGGPTDVVARIVTDHMSRSLGQQIVIENVAGAGGTTGSTRVATASNDGYTIMMGHMGTHGAAPALYPNLKYDPSKDFEPVGLAAGTPIIIVSSAKIPASDLKSFIAYLKANATKVNQAHAGVGSVSHSTGILFNSMIDLKPTQVPYKGTGPALNDLVSGQVDYMTDQIVNVVEQIKGGAVRGLAIATPERSPALPDLPTTKEAGLPDYQVSAWNAIFAPKGTSKDIVDKLNSALTAALADDNTKKRLLELGAVLPSAKEGTPAWLGDFVKIEVARWSPVLKAAGATAN